MDEIFSNLKSMLFLTDPLGLAINLIILALFTLGVLDVIKAMRNLMLERGRIKRASAVLQDSDKQCPTGSVEAVLGFLGITEKSLLGRRVSRVLELRAAGLAHRDVLQQLSAERIEGYGALARYIGVVLTLLGLLGTIFGMSLALFKIESALAAVNDVEGLGALVTALGATLRGMKTAFGCTMAGLLTAILLSYLNYLVRRRQSAVVHSLEELVLCDLLPALQEIDPDADNAARNFAEVVTSAASSLRKVQTSITKAASNFSEASDVSAGTAAAMEKAVQSFGNHITQVVGNQQGFTDLMRETQTSLHTMTDAVTKQFEEVRTFTASSNQLLEKRLAAMEEGARTNRVHQENLQKLVDSFGPAVLEYHQQFKAAVTEMFAEFHSTLNKTLKDVNTQNKDGIVGFLSSSREAFAVALAQHQKGTSEMLKEQRDALHAFADMVLDARLNSGLSNERMSSESAHYLPQPVPVQEGGRQ
jgi:hypothetical protein